MNSPTTRNPQYILVIRFSSIGDIILTSGVLSALAAAYPQSKIIYVTKSAFSELAKGLPQVHEVVSLAPKESIVSLAKRLQSYAPFYLLDLHNKCRSLGLRILLKPEKQAILNQRSLKERLLIALSAYFPRAKKSYRKAITPLNVKQQRALQALDKQANSLPLRPLAYNLDEQAVREARIYLQAYGVVPTTPLIGIAPGSRWFTKRWPLPHFAKLAELCCAHGLQVILLGSPSELPLLQQIQQAAPAAVLIDQAGPFALFSAFISCCQAFVANDSGPLHLSMALKIPTVGIFGSTEPGFFDFREHRLCFKDLPCSPCSLYGRKRCPHGHLKCLQEISPAEVYRQIQELLTAKQLSTS